MLHHVSKELYRKHFKNDQSPYISEGYISLFKNKTDRVIRLMKEGDNSMGIIVGLKENTICSPFSAPFGGFHYTHEHLLYEIVYDFISNLKAYVNEQQLNCVCVTLPPDIYQNNMNAKCINAFLRLGFSFSTPDVTNWINLKEFDGTWTKDRVAQNLRKATRNELSCSIVTDEESMKAAYELIFRNRVEQGRKIRMTFDEIMEVNRVIPVDFFLVKDRYGENAGAGVFYRGHERIVQGIFLGDDMEKRPLKIIDFLVMNIFQHYKRMNYDYIDLGTSSLEGKPNTGLIRFKEIHNCVTSLRYTFSWCPPGKSKPGSCSGNR